MCCMSTKTGSIVIGVVDLIFCIILIGISAFALVTFLAADEYSGDDAGLSILVSLSVFNIVGLVFQLSADIFLLVGIFNSATCPVVLWLVIKVLDTTVTVILFCIKIYIGVLTKKDLIMLVLILLFSIWFTIVVSVYLSHERRIKRNRNREKMFRRINQGNNAPPPGYPAPAYDPAPLYNPAPVYTPAPAGYPITTNYPVPVYNPSAHTVQINVS